MTAARCGRGPQAHRVRARSLLRAPNCHLAPQEKRGLQVRRGHLNPPANRACQDRRGYRDWRDHPARRGCPAFPAPQGRAGPAGPVSLPDVYVARGAPDKVLVSAGGGPVELVRLMVAPGSYLMTAKLVAEGADSEEPFTGTVTLSTGDVAGFGHGTRIQADLELPLVAAGAARRGDVRPADRDHAQRRS